MSTSVAVVDGNGVVVAPFSMDEYVSGVANNAALHQQQQLAAAYDVACNALIGPNDVQADGTGKQFKKKSAWRKLGRYFNISTVIVRERVERGYDDLTGREELVATVIVRALAPWGQSAEALGKCSTREKRFQSAGAYQKRDADCPATAQTRATNRALSDLIAAGEVSAEEIEFGAGTADSAAAEPPYAYGDDLSIDQALSTPLIGDASNWAGHGGKPLGEVPPRQLQRALAWVEQKLRARHDDRLAVQAEALTLVLAEYERREAATPHADGAVPPAGRVTDAVPWEEMATPPTRKTSMDPQLDSGD